MKVWIVKFWTSFGDFTTVDSVHSTEEGATRAMLKESLTVDEQDRLAGAEGFSVSGPFEVEED